MSQSFVAKRLCIAALVSVLSVVTTSAARSAAPPAKKPASRGVKGTAQLPGDVGQVGVTYTLTPNGSRPFNFAINKLAYVASRMLLNGRSLIPQDANIKFLVIDFTVQNPNSDRPYNVSRGFIDMTAVDALGQNHRIEDKLEDLETHQTLNNDLKPGQKVSGRAYIEVPAAGETPKLMLGWRAAGGRVMRYDLHGKVSPVEAILQDPADPSGATALTVIKDAKIGTAYPTNAFDITVEKFEIVPGPMGNGHHAAKGDVFLVTTVNVRNAATYDEDFRYRNDTTADVLDADGEKHERDNAMYRASSDTETNTSVPAGGERRFRILTQVPQGEPLKTLTLALSKVNRQLIYDLSNVANPK